jgi:hypothetical protein
VLTETRVTAALERLAERRVCGILEIDGNPDLIAEPDRPDRDIGTVLVQRKYLSRDHLQAILRSIIVDAALVLMVPVDRDAFVSDVRFAAPGTHWAGAFSSLCVDSVLAEASKMAERVARYNLARTEPVQLRDLGGPAAVLSREQWAVACAIDGTRSVQDLAWQCGLALYDVMERVGGLVQAGVCAPAQVGYRLPDRAPAGPQPTRPMMSAPVWVAGAEPPGDFAAVQPDLLRRVLDGLRKPS